jgi:hypothetical protein
LLSIPQEPLSILAGDFASTFVFPNLWLASGSHKNNQLPSQATRGCCKHRHEIRRCQFFRKAQWAMTVNGPWRICFEFRKGDAFNVEIVNYHKG